jgi:hypothetical protein
LIAAVERGPSEGARSGSKESSSGLCATPRVARAQKIIGLHPAPRLGYTPPMPAPSDLSFIDSLTSEQRQIFYERHRFLAILMILVVLLLPFAGLYVTGLFGAVLGLLLSLAVFYLTPYVWLKIGG